MSETKIFTARTEERHVYFDVLDNEHKSIDAALRADLRIGLIDLLCGNEDPDNRTTTSDVVEQIVDDPRVAQLFADYLAAKDRV